MVGESYHGPCYWQEKKIGVKLGKAILTAHHGGYQRVVKVNTLPVVNTESEFGIVLWMVEGGKRPDLICAFRVFRVMGDRIELSQTLKITDYFNKPLTWSYKAETITKVKKQIYERLPWQKGALKFNSKDVEGFQEREWGITHFPVTKYQSPIGRGICMIVNGIDVPLNFERFDEVRVVGTTILPTHETRSTFFGLVKKKVRIRDEPEEKINRSRFQGAYAGVYEDPLEDGFHEYGNGKQATLHLLRSSVK